MFASASASATGFRHCMSTIAISSPHSSQSLGVLSSSDDSSISLQISLAHLHHQSHSIPFHTHSLCLSLDQAASLQNSTTAKALDTQVEKSDRLEMPTKSLFFSLFFFANRSYSSQIQMTHHNQTNIFAKNCKTSSHFSRFRVEQRFICLLHHLVFVRFLHRVGSFGLS